MKVTELFEKVEDEKIFPNTPAGAIEALKFMADKGFLKELDLKSVKVKRDPSVEGVWAIDSLKAGIRVIVYLAGYKDPYKQKRELNDFEEGDLPASAVKEYERSGDLSEKEAERLKKKLGYK